MSKEIDHICFLVATSQYATFRYFTDQFASAFERQGVRVSILDLLDGKFSQEEILGELIRERPTLTCSFNIVYVIKPHELAFDALQIPHWTITVDPAAYYSHLVKAPSALFSAVDRGECELLRGQNPRVFFLPHGVERDILQPPSKREERDYEAVFIGSCYDYDGLRHYWNEELPVSQAQLLEASVELFFSHPPKTLMEAFLQAYKGSMGVPMSSLELKNLLFYFDHYIRGRSRVEMVKSLKKLRIHIFGDIYPSHSCCQRGWHYYLADQDHIVVHPPLPFLQVPEVLRRSKCCLNSMPFFQDGSHERVLMALACGSIAITSPSRWLEEQFTSGEELWVYTPETSATIEEELCHMVADEQRRFQYAENGFAKVAACHTWDQRAASALEALPPLL